MLIDKNTLLANIRKNGQLSMEDAAWVIKMIKEAPGDRSIRARDLRGLRE